MQSKGEVGPVGANPSRHSSHLAGSLSLQAEHGELQAEQLLAEGSKTNESKHAEHSLGLVPSHAEHPSGQAAGLFDPSRPNPSAAVLHVLLLPEQLHSKHPGAQTLKMPITPESQVPVPSIA